MGFLDPFLDPVRYYEVSHFTRIMEWCVIQEPKLWVDLEQAMVAGLPWIPLHSCPMAITQHPTIGADVSLRQHVLSLHTQILLSQFWAPLHFSRVWMNHNLHLF